MHDRIRIPQKRKACKWPSETFLDMRIHHWFYDYNPKQDNVKVNSEQEKDQEEFWKKAPSIFVTGSVHFAKAQLLAPAVNFLSLEHDQTVPPSIKFMRKMLRNDYQVVRNIISMLFLYLTTRQLLCTSLADVDAHLLGHEFDQPSQSPICSDKSFSALEEHRLAVLLWDVCHQQKTSCDAGELKDRKEIAVLLTDLGSLSEEEEENEEENDDSFWLQVRNLPA
jgi:hypothetical protein